MSSITGERLLRKLALERLGNRFRRISRTGDSHGLIYVGTAGERITDRTAQAGRCAAERFNFRRTVMCLVLEVDQPLVVFSVYIDGNDDGAGIDLV